MAFLATLLAATLAAAPSADAKGYYQRGFRSRSGSKTVKKTPYNYAEALGHSLRFFEIQRSGAIDSAPGGNQVPWRHDQLLEDGSDVGLDLSGGHYEAGNRLKITLASGFALSRLAFSCLYHADVYSKHNYQGRNMMYWCKREVKWGAEYLLKTHVTKGGSGSKETFGPDDKFVIMVGRIQEEWGGPNPGDFDCYRRAENIPSQPNCGKQTRATLLGSLDRPAADAAAEASAALATAAALLYSSEPEFAKKCIKASHALYDFAEKRPQTAVDEMEVKLTYPSSSPETNILWASSVLAWVHGCDKRGTKNGKALCDNGQKKRYLDKAKKLWYAESTRKQLAIPMANWDNSVFDSSFMLSLVTNEYTYIWPLVDYLNVYINADGGRGIGATPKGMRTYADNTWSSLRLGTYSSYLGLLYATLPNAEPWLAMRAECYARSQLGYIFGDTGRSYVVGSGKKWPKQVHHREAACTLEEDAAGKCDRKSNSDKSYMFLKNRPNPYDTIGAIVGGPDDKDNFKDIRNDYHFTEVAIDYNVALTMATAAVLGAPDDLFTRNCKDHVPNYPW